MQKKSGRWLTLQHWFLKSPAWRGLPCVARALYLEIAMRYNGSNNGRISYSAREAAQALKISKATACRALELLRARGFIACTRKGAFSLKAKPEASEWRLTEHANDVIPAHATKDFMSWQPEEAAQNLEHGFSGETVRVP
jgi:DNA-binding transcriptional MocR family regulator